MTPDTERRAGWSSTHTRSTTSAMQPGPPEFTSAARGAALYMAANAALTVSGYVVAVVLGRGLGPAFYGVYGLIYSVLMSVELIGRLGVPQALSQRIASTQGSSRDLESAGVAISGLVNLVIFAAFWLSSPALARLFGVEDGAHLFRIASLDIPFYGLYVVGAHILNGRRRFAAEAGGILAYSAVRTAGILLLFFWLGLSVEAALLVNVATSVVGLTYVFSFAGLPRLALTRVRMRELALAAVPIGMFGIGTQVLSNLDLWVLNAVGHTVPEATKGLYVAATSLAKMPYVVHMVMMAVLIPTLARALTAGDRETAHKAMNGTARFLAVGLLPASALVAVAARPILELTFSESYAAGSGLLGILIFAHGLLYPVMITASSMLIAADRSGTAARVTLLGIPVALVADVTLTSLFGATGAAVGALLSFGAAAVAAVAAVHRQVLRVEAPRGLVTVVVASLGVAAAGAAIPAGPRLIVPEILVLAVVYLAVLAKLGVVGADDLALLRKKRA